jgi:hypothetical protein
MVSSHDTVNEMTTTSNVPKTDNPVHELARKAFGSYGKAGREIGISAQAVSELAHGRSNGATAKYAFAAASIMTPSQRKRVHNLIARLWPS